MKLRYELRHTSGTRAIANVSYLASVDLQGAWIDASPFVSDWPKERWINLSMRNSIGGREFLARIQASDEAKDTEYVKDWLDENRTTLARSAGILRSSLLSRLQYATKRMPKK